MGKEVNFGKLLHGGDYKYGTKEVGAWIVDYIRKA